MGLCWLIVSGVLKWTFTVVRHGSTILNRFNFITGLGVLATGTAVVDTGAFTSGEVNLAVSVEFTDDSGA
jgi:hypothetical protein